MFTSKTPWLVVLLAAQSATAEITLAPLFQDGGVLQREKSVPVWGRASAGKSVAVSFAGQTKTTTADAGGRWQVSLASMPASAESRTMTVTEQGLPPVEVKDLLVGEVWLGSGQSNMEFLISRTRKEDQDEAASGPVPAMRLFTVPKVVNNVRQETVNSKWLPATPENAKDFSAVAYLFGKKLAEELKVPIGMIHSSWGGSRIEPWWAEEGFDGIEDLAKLREYRLARSPGFPEYDKPYRNYITTVRNWADEAAKALDNSLPAPEMPKAPELLKVGSGAEVGTYQAMIHPLVPYALRGFLWYQGESNNGEGMAYTTKMQALIAGWRKQFQAADAPFLFVQLAPYNYGDNRKYDLAGIWWAQQEALKIPHTGMAVTNDIGNIRDIHPTNKGDVARRLALWALADTYGKKDIVKSGPLFSQYKAIDGGIAIAFDHTGGGLGTRDGRSPTLFEIAGINGDYQPADAKINADGKTIFLTSPAVPKPDRVRFAWSQLAEPNLINKEGLPAGAFNTHWPNDPTLGHKVSGGKPHQSSNPNAHGWDSGVTDGTWGNESSTCYATDESPNFPKTLTVDLGSAQPIHVINYGTPNVGATKTIAVSISEDGKNFTEVGRNEFPTKKAMTAQARFDAKQTRYIRATFIDSHPQQDQYSATFGFLSELEAYAP
jgi:sialate O-acetylesterase